MAEIKKTKRKKTSNKKRVNSDIGGAIYIVVGLILAIAIYTEFAGILSQVSQSLLHRIIGSGMYLIPLAITYVGFSMISNDGKIIFTRRNIGVSVSLIVLLMFLSTVKIQTLKVEGFYNGLQMILTEEKFSVHGGFVGHVISYPFSRLFGFVGSYILYFSVLSLTIMMAFDIKVKEVILSFRWLYNKISSEVRKLLDNNKEKKLSKPVSKKITLENECSVAKTDFSKLENEIEILDYMNDSKVEVISKDSEVKIFNPNMKTKEDNSNVLNKEIEKGLINNKETIYIHPKTDLLNDNGKAKLRKEDKNELLKSAGKLEETLNSFGVEAKVTKVTKGPSVTRFELQPSPGVKVSKIVNLQDDIALGLAAGGIRMEAPIPGKAAIGIEVPNKSQTPVFLREVLESNEFNNSDKKLAFALGKDIGGEHMVGDLSKMPHMLIAGATGSGKSVCVNSLIVSLIYKYSPTEVKLLMVDPKVVELSVYNDIPHLLIPVVTDPKKAAGALNWAVNEMNRRYNLFSNLKVKNIESYNKLLEKGTINEKLPYIVIIVDELADLMMACPGDVEDYICRLAQMARAAGMHLIIATQRPSVDVITGVIKANIPSRISFAVSSGIDSRTIIDQYGAEKLLGRGDMLYYPMGANKPLRVQGAFISEEEVENVVEFIKNSHEVINYEEEILNHINNGPIINEIESDDDELLEEAINIVIEYNQASTSFLQRKLKIGFNRASRIMDALESKGIISSKDGSKARQVLVTKEDSNNNY